MRFVFYTHSLASDWNHGNAHFLRGVMRDLLRRGHDVSALEPADGWSRSNLVADQGREAIRRFHLRFPDLETRLYNGCFRHDEALDGADVVIVHEWTDPVLIAHIGKLKHQLGFTLLFHDTHHRAVSSPGEMERLNLAEYDGLLVFGEALRERYLEMGWGARVFTWHEAADDTVFRPETESEADSDLVWVGNWGDGERSEELESFLIGPAHGLGLAARVHGVRYPDEAKTRLRCAGIDYRGWIANADVPAAFARSRVTVHVPRRLYAKTLPGIPTIRPFEAMACGIPMVSAPWDDCEGLFRPGQDYLLAEDGEAMKRQLRRVLVDRDLAQDIARSGLETIRSRHTCRHRVDELLSILSDIEAVPAAAQSVEFAE